MIDYQGRTQERSCNPYSVKTWQGIPKKGFYKTCESSLEDMP
jgi:hypothetical protein